MSWGKVGLGRGTGSPGGGNSMSNGVKTTRSPAHRERGAAVGNACRVRPGEPRRAPYGGCTDGSWAPPKVLPQELQAVCS